MNPTQCAYELMKKRKIFNCEVPGCNNPGEEAHHCLYGKKKGVKELDMPENLAVVCRDCHKFSGKALSYEFRVYFWGLQCKRYGKKHMVEWHNKLPLKVKEYAFK